MSASSKDVDISMDILQHHHAREGLEVQLLTGHEDIDHTLVRGGGSRASYIKQIDHFNHQSASMKASTTEHTSDLEELFLSPCQLEASEGILQNENVICVKTLGASDTHQGRHVYMTLPS